MCKLLHTPYKLLRYTNCVILLCILKHSSCFVPNFAIIPTYAVCVKIWPQKLRSGKSFDKYHIWLIHRTRNLCLDIRHPKSPSISENDVCSLFFHCKKRLEYFDLLNHRTSTFVLKTVSSTD